MNSLGTYIKIYFLLFFVCFFYGGYKIASLFMKHTLAQNYRLALS